MRDEIDPDQIPEIDPAEAPDVMKGDRHDPADRTLPPEPQGEFEDERERPEQ